MNTHRFGCFALAGLLLACGEISTPQPVGGSGSASGSPAPTSSTKDALTLACESLFDVNAIYDRERGGEPMLAEQRPSFVASCVGLASAPGSLVAASDVQACAAEVAKAPRFGGSGPTCLGFGSTLLFPGGQKLGSGAQGDACVAAHQCASGACGASWGECGQCVTVRALGEACDDATTHCAAGSCRDGVCAYNGQRAGEVCFNKGFPCQDDLFCGGTDATGTETVCTPKRAAGEPCHGYEECLTGYSCVEGHCVGPQAPLAVGAPCGDSAAPGRVCLYACRNDVCDVLREDLPVGATCVDGECGAGLLCSKGSCTYVPAPPPVLALGSPCGDGQGRCGDDAYCSENGNGMGVCEPNVAVGERCLSYNACGRGARCMDFNPSTGGICRRDGLIGDACPCFFDLACVDGVCQPYGLALCQ